MAAFRRTCTALALWLGAVASNAEVSVDVGDVTVSLSTRGPSAFRLRLVPKGHAVTETVMVDDALKDARFERYSHLRETGIKSAFGSLAVTSDGKVVLADNAGKILTQSEPITNYMYSAKNDYRYRDGVGAWGGSCTCPDGTVYQVGDNNRACEFGGASMFCVGGVPGECEKVSRNERRGMGVTCAGARMLALSTTDGVLYGKGASPKDAEAFTQYMVSPLVCNEATFTPYYYAAGDRYGALGATAVDSKSGNSMKVNYRTNGKTVTWTWNEGYLELYLLPADTLEEGTQRYYELIGRPSVLPKYAYGFGASRWGWEDRQYIEDVIKHFRNGSFPIDYIIVDFEWFVTDTDYGFGPPGQPSYKDFGWNPKLFNEPQQQLKEYREKYHIKFAGIRKPRIGNAEILKDIRPKGWLLPGGEPGGSYPPDYKGSYAIDRCLDFANPDVRDWYASELAHYTNDGVAFWWNDEGEPNYNTYHWWNVAERQAMESKASGKRFFSLNRAFTPGMSRLGAAAWTGDIEANWEFLRKTPGTMLNWVLGGAAYVGCDIGGFNGNPTGEELTRWIQVGVFMPIMRVHSVISSTPHFPWLWGDEAATALRSALELRYRLLPYHYSLAHRLYKTHRHYIRPMFFEFPQDRRCANMATQWMFGDILVAPILRADSARDVYLPSGSWYLFAGASEAKRTILVEGERHLDGTAGLGEVPAFVRPGAIIPLAPVVQSTEELPGGPLEVQIYAGSDGAFELCEDDGDTTKYTRGVVRTTSFKWSQSERTLSWTVSGAEVPRAFVKVWVKLFDEDVGVMYESESRPLGDGGSIRF